MAKKCPKCQSDNPGTATFCADCGTQLPSIEDIEVTVTIETPKEELTTGSTFAGRYQIIEELGKGGMGRVYKVLDTEVNAKVALKLIKPEIASDKKTIERFRNELKVARDIAHKNVCRMYDLGKEEGAYYITMEYVSGEDLKSFIRRSGIISIGKAISIANQVCEGLLEAHRLGVVHRDLKPQNIMIDKEGNARIMDFGIARSLRAKGITGSGVMIGTPEYMSPEQVDGKEADQRADIYSLGIIIYEMVTGKVPFEGDTPFSIGVKQKSEEPRPPKEINEQIPEDLNYLILKCMEKDKEKRFQSVGELHSELMSLEKGVPTTERVVPERKPLTSREITVQLSPKKLLIPAIVIVAVVLIGFIFWRILPKQKKTTLDLSGKPSLAVMYFQNNTGDQNFDIWRDGLSRMLIADLSQSKYIRIVSDDQLYGILSKLNLLEANNYSTEDLKEVAARGRSTHILRGILTKSGDSFRINTTLQESKTMEIVASEMVEGRGEGSLHTMVDELTRRIKENFKLTEDEIANDIDKEVGIITTNSPEAYKYFNEGYECYLKTENRKSIPFLEKAIAIDPEFAMAYRTLAAVYSNMGYRSKKREYTQKAFELINRVSDRERYRIQGEFYLLSEKTYDKATEALNRLLQLYPDDWIGNNSLGNMYRISEQWDKAIDQYNVNVQNGVEAWQSYHNIALAYGAVGLYEKARGAVEYYLNNIGKLALSYRRISQTYVCQRKYDLALAELDKALSLNPNPMNKGYIYHLQGDFIQAEREYQKWLKSEEPLTIIGGRNMLAVLYLQQGKYAESKKQAMQSVEMAEKLEGERQKSSSLRRLSYVYLKSGNSEQALEECKKAWSHAVKSEWLGEQINVLHLMGLISFKMKLSNEVQKSADQLNEIIDTMINKKVIRYYYNLLGMLELSKENYSGAIEYLNKATSLLPFQTLGAWNHVLFNEPLAMAYYKAGDLEKARIEYELITEQTTGRLHYGDIYIKAFYMLGKINEELGNTADAIEHYEKFLDLWKDADPGIAEVEDAKKRLAGLKSN